MTVTYEGYKDSELEVLDAPFMPSYRPVAGAGAVGVVLGLGAWIRIYGPKLGRFLWDKAVELEKLRSVAVNKLKQVPTKSLQRNTMSLDRNTMGDLSRLEANNPEAFKKVSPQIRKQYGKQKLDFQHKSSQQYQQSQRQPYKNYKPGDKKAWVGGKTMKQADKDITQAKKLEAQRARESLSRDKPPSKFDPNKGKSTRPQSLLGPRKVFRLKKKKPKK